MRSRESGRSWRILIVASVVFVLLQVLQLVEILLRLEIANQLGQVVALIFAMAFAYAFYRERALYTGKCAQKNRQADGDEYHDEDADLRE